MNLKESLHSAYFETHFRHSEFWVEWPDEFAIIAAFATTGVTWTPAENEAADKMLETELRASGKWMRRLTGFSPATGHAEPGWAVELAWGLACDLGHRFHQDAIYYVTGDTLWVTHCDHLRGLVSVGAFRQRLQDSSAPSETVA